MNFGRVNSGAKAGFVAGAVSGPIYGLTALISSRGDVFDIDSSFGTGLLMGIPVAILFGCVLAGLPGILFGMAAGASIGDRPMTPPVATQVAAAGAVLGIMLLQGVDDTGLTTSLIIRGAVVGGLSAYVWARLFDLLRRRSTNVVDLSDEPDLSL